MQATTMRSQQSVRWWCIIDLGFIHLSCQAFYHQTLTQIWFQNHGWFMICLGIIHPIYSVYWGLSCMDFLAVFGFGGGFSSSSGRHLSVLRHSDLLLSLPLLCPLPLPLLWWLALKISKTFFKMLLLDADDDDDDDGFSSSSISSSPSWIPADAVAPTASYVPLFAI